ncbi:hypothetical protein GS429_07110 [Natronorubrum sp. JWXQ-INN-674]|uniref:DUF7344 domain-containing protein n=1 Tax=Natronorubrum halalkaliphilum TaxID=2691917 RepID=A0A6B0VJZ2_9EURY|nr:hypothetical protein [Natronorubrum halalkaliphilum]MXV61838.1 hypothetical protein [Natronorubrum halalkaliphilum]
MKSNAFDPDDVGTSSREIEPTTMFEALSHERRQYALQYLAQKPAAVPLGDVAEYIAVREGEPTRDRYERILTGFYHLHLPHLLEAKLIAYDEGRKTVTLRVNRDVLHPYLDLLTAKTCRSH